MFLLFFFPLFLLSHVGFWLKYYTVTCSIQCFFPQFYIIDYMCLHTCGPQNTGYVSVASIPVFLFQISCCQQWWKIRLLASCTLCQRCSRTGFIIHRSTTASSCQHIFIKCPATSQSTRPSFTCGQQLLLLVLFHFFFCYSDIRLF